MPEHHVLDDLGAFALGALDPADAARVREHLASCPECADQLGGYRAVASELNADRHASPLLEPSWESIHARITSAPGGERRWPRRARVLATGWIATAAVLALVSGWFLWDQLSSSPAADVASLARDSGNVVPLASSGGTSSGAMTGRLYISDDGTQGGLAVTGLSPTGGTYEVWFVRPDQTRVSAGTFKVDSRGSALVKLSIPGSLDQYDGVAVCPAGWWEGEPDLLSGPLYE